MFALALKASLILAAALLITAAFRRRSAAERHLVLTVALAGILALPFLSGALPRLPIPAPAAGFTFSTTVTASPPAREAPATPPRPVFNGVASLALLWGAGSALALARVLIAFAALARMRRRAAPAPDSAFPGLAILTTVPGAMPMAFGIFRPVILLPAESSAWPPARRLSVLLHERAHIQRRDPATQLIARLALAVYWWNPLAWLAAKQFLKEQERAADDLVLATGTRASDYAAHLLEVARAMRSGPPLLSVAMARSSQLEHRLRAILDPSLDRRSPGRVTAAVTAVAAIALMLPLAAASPQSTGPSSGKSTSAEALKDLGIKALSENRPDAALTYLERAKQADSSLAASASLWMAVARQRQAKPAEAEASYREALALATPASPGLLSTLRLFARFLREQNRTDEAQALEARAEAAAKRPAPAFSGYRVGNGVSAPSVLSKVDPEYTEEARAARLTGTVTLMTEIGSDGLAHNITPTNLLGLGLDDRATAAVSQWRFNPGMKDGEPVAVRATIEVNFRLN